MKTKPVLPSMVTVVLMVSVTTTTWAGSIRIRGGAPTQAPPVQSVSPVQPPGGNSSDLGERLVAKQDGQPRHKYSTTVHINNTTDLLVKVYINRIYTGDIPARTKRSTAVNVRDMVMLAGYSKNERSLACYWAFYPAQEGDAAVDLKL